MMILKDPDWARSLGLISAKAQITAGTADWPTYFSLLAQATAVGGFVLFGLIEIWIFGREFVDRTVNDLLALPTSREAIVAAKLVVAALLSFLMAAIVFTVGLGIGGAIGLPGWSADLVSNAAVRVAVIAGLTILLVTPLALVASTGRGYLPAIGFMFLLLFLAQISAALGWGAYFSWSVPALASGAAGPGAEELGFVSYLLVVLVGVVGTAGTVAWWRLADQT